MNFNEKDLNPDVYHMMDFRVSQKKATQFVYILPYSTNSALVELTRFGKELLKEDEAKKELDDFWNLISRNGGKYIFHLLCAHISLKKNSLHINFSGNVGLFFCKRALYRKSYYIDFC